MKNEICIALFVCVSLLSTSYAGFFSKRNVLLKSLKYKPCTTKPTILYSDDARVSTTADGDLIISGAISVAMELHSPLKVKLSMSRKVLGLSIPVPCVMSFGSCTYDDICQYGYPGNATCPGKLDEHDIPCRCPLPQGRYDLPGAQFKIDPTRFAGLLAGTYKGTARLIQGSLLLACFDYIFELQ